METWRHSDDELERMLSAEELGERLAAAVRGWSAGARDAGQPGVLARNLVFMPIVLAHGFRRLLPPY